MLFSSLIFLYAFLPLVLLAGWASGQRFQNYVLLIFSLVFYAWGGVSAALVVMASIVFNYFLGRAVGSAPDKLKAKRWLILCVVGNLLIIAVIKYAPFVVENLNVLLHAMGISPLRVPAIKLIPGVSFFTFHSISYVVDIYRRDAVAQKNVLSMGLYIIFFPQLIAGPIVRYHEIADQLHQRVWKAEHVAAGMKRFILGLTKKVVFSNTFAYPADKIFSMSAGQVDTPLAWLGIVCYSLHIYCDFSGYSDMALGLGKMFGFTFPENFNFPYSATSIQDFWRRWHMTLSRWFRDYVYIPLGGNKGGSFKTYRNLGIVFFLTGLWHGAAWTMVIWGLFHGLFLILERVALKNILPKLFLVNRVYTLLVVMIAWVFFRAPDLPFALQYIGKLFGINGVVQNAQPYQLYFTIDFVCILIVAILFSSGIFAALNTKLLAHKTGTQLLNVWRPVEYISTLFLFVLCTLLLTHDSYNPFIYFRF